MTHLTAEEKKMMDVAARLRHLVKADVEKTAADAIAYLLKALLPALRSLGPKVLETAKLIPPDVWGKIAIAIATMIQQAATAKRTASVYDPSSLVLNSIADIEKKLVEAGVTDADILASYVVLAATKAVEDHQTTPNKNLVRAVLKTQKAQDEVSFLRKFM